MKKKEKNCHFCKKDLYDITVSFKKRSDVLTTGNTHFDTTTNKIETIEFYDYYNHHKDFDFISEKFCLVDIRGEYRTLLKI